MTDQIGSGKILFISGAAYSGKTYLIALLKDSFPHAKIVNYERFFKAGGYKEFYSECFRLYDLGHFVIAESINNYIGHNHKFSPKTRDRKVLNILCEPNIVIHNNNYSKYFCFAGRRNALNRLGSSSIERMRKNVKVPATKYHRYTCENFDDIKKVVCDYANDN